MMTLEKQIKEDKLLQIIIFLLLLLSIAVGVSIGMKIAIKPIKKVHRTSRIVVPRVYQSKEDEKKCINAIHRVPLLQESVEPTEQNKNL